MIKVVIEQFDADGIVTSTDLVSTHTILSEAIHKAKAAHNAMNEKAYLTHRVVIFSEDRRIVTVI